MSSLNNLPLVQTQMTSFRVSAVYFWRVNFLRFAAGGGEEGEGRGVRGEFCVGLAATGGKTKQAGPAAAPGWDGC